MPGAAQTLAARANRYVHRDQRRKLHIYRYPESPALIKNFSRLMMFDESILSEFRENIVSSTQNSRISRQYQRSQG